MPQGPQPGPLNGPSPTAWRRERLLRLGSATSIPQAAAAEQAVVNPSCSTSPETPASEDTALQASGARPISSYGAIPSSQRLLSKRSFSLRLPGRSSSLSHPSSPQSPSAFRDLTFTRLSNERPISAYDEPLASKDEVEPDSDTKINGIRVWYSSYSSIDWLHDAIKDSARFSRLRKRKSVRARVRLVIDRSLGWFIVTIVGFFTAVVAFLVVRSEQWMFDSKEGFCTDGWWKAKRYCCSDLHGDGRRFTPRLANLNGESCPNWRTWADLFALTEGGVERHAVEYVSYACIAVLLALISSLLTICLTDSRTFSTRKESGVLASDVPDLGIDSKLVDPRQASKRRVMYYAAGSGIPEIKTILSGFVIHGYLGARTLFTKAVGLSLSVASGLSLGKEGPFVHIASCVGNIISRFFGKYENNEAKRREILSAACAAGVAVAFGAPIGGTLFSLEEVSYFFPPKVMWRSFFCAMIAAITLKILDPFGTGKLVLFQVTYDKDWHAWELLPFILLGVFGGLYGAYFSKFNYRWSKDVRNKTWLKSQPVMEVVLITLLTTALCFLNPYTRMSGTELVYNLFAECKTGSGNTHSGLCVLDPSKLQSIWPVIKAILVAMVVKAGLTVITFGIKVPAGIFIPSLGVGACAGRVFGIIMQWQHWQHPDSRLFRSCHGDMDCIIPGLYAMVGAAATLSGVTRTAVSLAVIMFELTDTLTYAVPIMLSVLVAKTVADALEPKGIYDLVIDLSQLPYLDSKHEYLWDSLQINEVTSRDVETIQLDRKNTVKSLRDQLYTLTSTGHDDSGFPILRCDGEEEGMRLVGYIGANELEHALSLVADHPDEEVRFHNAYAHPMASSSISSMFDDRLDSGKDLFDFSPYMDQAPLTVLSNSPMEMVHQFFSKLGARYVIVTDTEGLYEGVIDKKTWIAFLSDLEERS